MAHERVDAAPTAPPRSRGCGSAAEGPTRSQWAVLGLLALGLSWSVAIDWRALLSAAHIVFLAVFGLGVAWRLAALACPSGGSTPLAEPVDGWPSYTVIVPLYHEADVAADLLRNLQRIDYPRERLQVIVALEAHDFATQAAVRAAHPPPWIEVLVCPPGHPRTKPRACNIALAHATGEIVVVFDAEDAPDPRQLREAAARFAAGPTRLACLQAPLRVPVERLPAFERQFAFEYAALFEVMLSAYVRWRLPFPLGGTSNHFRRDTLEAIGGWDPWNVTEDADIGMRLAAEGYETGVLTSPTWETPPDFAAWVPQRTRWVKGYMQTWGVHMRRPLAGGWRGFVALQLTLGYAILSALLHGPLTMTVVASLFAVLAHWPPQMQPVDVLLCGAGWVTSIALMAVGAQRAGARLSPRDALFAPAYWPLQSWAAVLAVHQLATRPFHWNKTRHRAAASNA